jgi:hypothetical protein
MQMPSRSEDGEGFICGEEAVESTQRICRGKECDTNRKTRRVNWGSSELQNASGIIHKPERKFRDSDVAIVSGDPFGLNNRMGSQGPLDWWCDQKGAVPLGQSRLRVNRRVRRANTVVAYKRLREGGHGVNQFEAVLGKTRRTEF